MISTVRTGPSQQEFAIARTAARPATTFRTGIAIESALPRPADVERYSGIVSLLRADAKGSRARAFWQRESQWLERPRRSIFSDLQVEAQLSRALAIGDPHLDAVRVQAWTECLNGDGLEAQSDPPSEVGRASQGVTAEDRFVALEEFELAREAFLVVHASTTGSVSPERMSVAVSACLRGEHSLLQIERHPVAFDALFRPDGANGIIHVGSQFPSAYTDDLPVSVAASHLALLAHEGFPGHALEQQLHLEFGAWGLMVDRDRDLSEGWAVVAESRVADLLRTPVALSAPLRSVMRRALAVILAGSRSSARRVVADLPEPIAEGLLTQASRTFPQAALPYVRGIRRWREAGVFAYGEPVDWLTATNELRNVIKVNAAEWVGYE